MPEYRAPGVYVEEVDKGPKSVEGVGTSTAAFLGETERGPTSPSFITNFADFERTYGGFAEYSDGGPLAGTYLAYAVDGFFRNGGTRAYVGRVVPKDTPTATTELRATESGSPTPRVDFGTIPDDGETRKHLVLHNTAAVPLTVTPSLGATTIFDLSSDLPTVVAPGAAAVFGIDFTIGDGDPDPAEEGLTITYAPESDPSTTTATTIELIGHGDRTLATDRSKVEFAPQVVGETAVQHLTLTNRADTDIESLAVNDPGSGFSATVKPETLRPGGEASLTVTFAPEDLSEPSPAETLTISYDISNSGSDTLEIPLEGAVRQPLAVETPVLDFGLVHPDDAGEQTVTIQNVSDTDLTLGDPAVTKEDSEPDRFTVTAVAEPDKTIPAGETLDLTVTLADAAGTNPRTLEIPYTNQDGTALTQTVGLYGGTSEDMTVDRLYVDFGEGVPNGTAQLQTLEITSTSGSGVTLPLTGLPSGFTTDQGDELQLIDGVSQTLSVSWQPTDEAETTETWTPDHPDSSEDPVVTLHGVGAMPFETSTAVTFATLTAVGPGPWGARVVGIVSAGSLNRPENPLFKLTLQYWTDPAEVQFVQDNGLDHPDAPAPDVEEIYDNLSLNEASSEYFVKKINAASKLVDVARSGDVTPDGWDVAPAWLTETFATPADPVTVTEYEGVDEPGARTGFAALREIDDINIVCVPDQAADSDALIGLTDSLVTHCETLKDRFAIVQANEGMTKIASIEPERVEDTRLDSSYAGFYYPWLTVRNPETRMPTNVPPGGHMAGIYARSDSERGVHKAPANEIVRGVQDVELSVTKAEQEVLNPKGVNCIRKFPGRGIRVWGARTASSDPSWKYINVRRLFLYIEESIDEGTQWVVFEPNDNGLWARVRQTITNFLTTVWRNGALMGTTAEEAFYVRCDRSTMTQDDIDNGRLIVEVGVAPVKPAEFVIFRISQWTDGAAGA